MFGVKSRSLCGVGLALLLQAPQVAAMPGAPVIAKSKLPYVVEAQVMCDYRGCFGFGPQQWYRPPNFPPSYLPPNRPPIYYRPRAVGVPSAPYYRNVPQQPAPQMQPLARLPTEGTSRHVGWCLDRYRSYNPETNRYMQTSGRYRVCVSPYDR